MGNNLIWGGNTSGTLRISLSNNLGWLNSGDTIYVAFGPGTIASFDSFATDFSVSRGIASSLDVLTESKVGVNDAYTW